MQKILHDAISNNRTHKLRPFSLMLDPVYLCIAVASNVTRTVFYNMHRRSFDVIMSRADMNRSVHTLTLAEMFVEAETLGDTL